MTDTTTFTVPALDELAAAEIQYRSATLDALDSDERIVELRAVPYEVETRLGVGVVEVFSRAAFARAAKDPGRCKLWMGHGVDGGHIVGQAFEVEDRDDGLWVRARVSHTAHGDELLTLADDRVLDEASIEFSPIREGMAITRRGEDTVVRHRRAHLRGVALVPHGAYGREALLTSVRDAEADTRRDEWLAGSVAEPRSTGVPSPEERVPRDPFGVVPRQSSSREPNR